MRAGPAVVKGGDGGAAVPEAMLHGASFEHDRDNLRVCLTCGGERGRRGARRGEEGFTTEAQSSQRGMRRGQEGGSGRRGLSPCLAVSLSRCLAELIATTDPFDCAHNQRTVSGSMYLEQGNGHVRAGLIGCPRREYPPSQIVSCGVAIDSMFDGLAARQARLEREGISTARVGAVPTGFLAELLDARLPRGVRLRDVLHQKTRQEGTPAEVELEREASRMLGQPGSRRRSEDGFTTEAQRAQREAPSGRAVARGRCTAEDAENAEEGRRKGVKA